MTVAGAAAEQASGEAYDARVDAAKQAIEALAPVREQARADGLRADAQAELDDARADYEREKAEADAQLADAKAELDDAAATLEESEQKLADGQAAYESGRAQLDGQKAATDERLSQAQAQLDDGQAALDAQKPQLDAAAEMLEGSWAQWEQRSAGLAQGWKDWHAQADGLYAARDQLQADIDALDAQIEALAQDDPDNPQIAVLQQQRDGLAAQLAQFELAYADELAAAEQARATLEQGERDLAAAKAQLDERQADYDQGAADYDEGLAELARRRGDLQAARDEAASRLADAERQLADAAAQLESGREQWEAGKADYDEGLASYEDARAEADAQLAEAQQKLDDAQRAIDDLEAPTWYVMDRTQNYGVAGFESDADRVDSIASVFPFIFFLVAALVALTTMTRMVEEERVLIGTYKALGYARWRIASKYLAYAALASVAGSAVGIAVLSQVLPAVIQKAYAIIYFVPQGPLPIDLGLAGACGRLGRGRHAGGHVGRRHGDAARKPGAAHAPARPEGGQAHPAGARPAALAAAVVLLEGHVPQPVPLQEALRHDHGGHRGLHGAAADGPGAFRRHQRHHRQAVRGDNEIQRHHRDRRGP